MKYLNKKVTGYWGAGIPLDFGKVDATHADGYITIKWDDGRRVKHNPANIQVGNINDGIGVYWGVDEQAIPFSNYWRVT